MIEQGLLRRIYSAQKCKARVLLAHGAGAGNQHPFIHSFSQQLAQQGIEVSSFNFPYMQLVYELDKKRPPNGNKALVAHFQQELNALVETLPELPIFIGGKSMGGRIATQLAAMELDSKVTGCFALGYPFIPPGKPEKLTQRISHFADCQIPVQILQGQRDTFGNTELLKTLSLPEHFRLTWVESGDHSFKPLKSSGLTEQQNIRFAALQVAQFIDSQLPN